MYEERFLSVILQIMMGIIRRLKMAYAVFNFFHRKELIHNAALFKKYGIKKNYFSSLSSKDFRNIIPGDGHPAITESELFQDADAENRQGILSFEENGFLIIRNYLSPAQVDAINAEVDNLIEAKTVKPGHQNKIMFAIHHSALLRSIGGDKKLMDLLGRLIHGEAMLFQSINFTMGSEQRTHSDSIHMTTYPPGGLLGVWIALDDINENNGPLHYYQGSHKLPYYLNSDYDNEGSAWLIGKKSYTEYEEMIANKIAEKGIQKLVFTAQKGDLLVWHANLFHGGEPHKDKSITRKSMVLHYFKKDSICYHEITQRPALIKYQNDK
jgi:ectoine hydroxylase-related dioxygenase (phytanoyl-CoA dioxygenase family)